MKLFRKLFAIKIVNNKTDKGILRSLYFKTILISSLILLLIELIIIIPACSIFGFGIAQATILSTLVYIINVIILLIWIVFLTNNTKDTNS